MEWLRNELHEYFGMLNEYKAGLKPDKIVEKPTALILYDQIRDTGLHLYSGGLRDQPYFFSLEFMVCKQETELWISMQPKAVTNDDLRGILGSNQ